MLNETILKKNFPKWLLAIGTYCATDLHRLRTWDRKTSWLGNLGISETLLVAASPSA